MNADLTPAAAAHAAALSRAHRGASAAWADALARQTRADIARHARSDVESFIALHTAPDASDAAVADVLAILAAAVHAERGRRDNRGPG